MSAAAAAALASADALQPGHGQLQAGVRLDAGLGARAFLDAEHKFTDNFEVYAEGDIAGLHDYSASAGLRVLW